MAVAPVIAKIRVGYGLNLVGENGVRSPRKNLDGEAIPFSAVARIEEGGGLGTIKHIDRKRTLTISGNAEGRPGPAILKDVRLLLEDFPLPAGYTLEYTGEFEDMGNTQNFLAIAFVIGLFLMAMIVLNV